MRYISILPVSSSDYYGFSVVLSVSGCSHKCDGCWSKPSWKHTAGSVFDETAYITLKKQLDQGHISNLVIQGGDPLYKKNYSDIISLCRRLKKELPDKNIVLFTGYTLAQLKEDILRAPILNTIDVLIDGKYEKNNPTTKPFRGSDNQRLYKLT